YVRAPGAEPGRRPARREDHHQATLGPVLGPFGQVHIQQRHHDRDDRCLALPYPHQVKRPERGPARPPPGQVHHRHGEAQRVPVTGPPADEQPRGPDREGRQDGHRYVISERSSRHAKQSRQRSIEHLDRRDYRLSGDGPHRLVGEEYVPDRDLAVLSYPHRARHVVHVVGIRAHDKKRKMAAPSATPAANSDAADDDSPGAEYCVRSVSPVRSHAPVAATDSSPSTGVHTHGRPAECRPAAAPAPMPKTMAAAASMRRLISADGSGWVPAGVAWATAGGRSRASPRAIPPRHTAHIASRTVVPRCAARPTSKASVHAAKASTPN